MFVAGGASAAEQVFDCTLRATTRGSWVGDRAIFWIDVEQGKARVLDGVVDHVFGEAIPADLEDRGNGKYAISWVVKEAPGQKGVTRVNYSAFLKTNSGKVTINALLPTYDNTSSGRGKCRTNG
jgi:hypothetical protein